MRIRDHMHFETLRHAALRWSWGVCLIWALLCCGPVNAQEAPKKEEKPTEWERLIYLPYKNFASVLEQEKSTVFMPYSQFLKLWRNSKPEVVDPNALPVHSVITQATYAGRIENNLVRLDATFKVKVLDKPWARVPLKFGDAAVGKLTAENEQILLIGTGEGTYDLLLPTVGEHTVKIELITRVHTSTEGKSFDLEIPLVGISNLELTIPAADQTVDVIPHLVSAPLESDAKTTKISANVGSTNKVTARWFPRVSKTPEMELLTSVTNQTHVRVADGLVQTEAALTYQVLRGELNQIVVAIPLGHRILDVATPNLKGWKAADEANRQLVTIDLLDGNVKTIPVEIRTERPAVGDVLELGGIGEDGKVDGIHAVGAVRESGIIVAGHGPELSLAVEHQRGLIRIEAGEVPEAFRRPENLYFKFYNSKFRLGVSAKPVEPRVTVTHASVLEFHDDQLKLFANLDYTVERAGVFELRYTIPDGVKIDSVDCEHKQEFTVTPDGKTLTLTLTQKTLGNIKVAIRGQVSFPEGLPKEPIKLPLLEPLTVAREQGTLQVYAPEAIEVVTDEKALVSIQPDRTAEHQNRGNLRLASAWTFNRRPVEIAVTTVRKPTRLTAQMATTLNVNREIVEVVSNVNFYVQYAGIDTFRLAVPAAISEQVQIEPVTASGAIPVKQKSQAEAKDGWVTWTIITQREVVGRQEFRVKYDLKLVKQDQTAKITIQPVRPMGVPGTGDEPERVPVTSLLAEMAIQKDRIWSLAATPKELQAIDVRELTLLPQDGALAYRYSRPEVEIQLTATEHEIQEVVQTVISRALVEAVLTQDETVTFRCRYRLKTSERQRLQLELPARVQPLGVMVAGKQVSLERSPNAGATGGPEMCFVNVARPGRSDEQFGLTLVYRIPAAALPETGFGGTIKVQIPQLGATTNQQAVAVQQLRVAVWVPEKLSLVGVPQHFTPEHRLRFLEALGGRTTAVKSTEELESWIGDTGSGLFEFPTAGHAYVYNNLGGAHTLEVRWWRTSWTTWIWSLAFLLAAFLLRGTSWENKLGMILIGGFAAALYALNDADMAMFIVSCGRYGILSLLAVWILHALLQQRKEPLPEPEPWTALAAVSPPPGVFEDLREAAKP